MTTIEPGQGNAPEAVEAAWRIESPRVIAGLVRMLGDISLAEEVAQDAFVAALERWPSTGVPRNPGAWLTTVAKRRAVDILRRRESLGQKVGLLARDIEAASRVDEVDPERIEDDLLRLIFVSCHPVLSPDARVALTLRLVGGLRTEEIARAFLVPEPTVAKRIVRAKRTLAQEGVPFEVPAGVDRAGRLDSVLEVIYLIYNEGYSATTGDDWMRPELCAEALRLGRMLAALMPGEPEVLGLVALMEIQTSRTAARIGAGGDVIRLLDQDRTMWNQLFIRRGFAALERAAALGPLGPYALQAAIAAEHARARTAEATDWTRIAALYEALAAMMPSPVVELNRAVAVGMARGPQAALPLIDALRDDPAMRDYHLLPSVRGDLLEKLGRFDEARDEFERAAGLTRNVPERVLLRDRARQCADAAAS